MKGGEKMSEFKAQILGMIIVLSLFTMVGRIANDVFDMTWTKIETINSNKIYEMTSV